MARINKSRSRYAANAIALLLGLSAIPSWVTPSRAVTFEPPGSEAPKQSSGGASRDGGKCASSALTSKSVTALIPSANQGLTLSERPTIFAYIPQTEAKEAFFSLQDENGNNHYQTTVRLPEKPGAIAIKLPAEAAALEIGKNYQWYLVMVCGQELEPDSPGVSGWIRRVEPIASLANQKQGEASLELASRLARAGIWYDTVSTLASLRRSQPGNASFTKSWEELLHSVGLDEIATEPLVN